jgi:hypothetical protein
MGLQIVTPPSSFPVTLVEAKAQLNVVDADDDDLIEQHIAAATQALDGPFGWTGRAIMPQQWYYYRDGFPGAAGDWVTSAGCGCGTTMTNCSGIEIPLPPLATVDQVAYADPDNPTSYLVMPSTDYAVDNAGYVGWVQPINGWPSAASSVNAVRIKFTAGYASVPADIKQAILMLVRDYYDQRGEIIVGVSYSTTRAVDALINGYRVLTV